jgi:hypothetical protein
LLRVDCGGLLVDWGGRLGTVRHPWSEVGERFARVARRAAGGVSLALGQPSGERRAVCCSGDPMGAWGTGAFDNDGAGDLLADIRHVDPGRRADVIREALQFAVEATDYLEAIEGQAAIVAAAVLAAGRSGRDASSSDGTETLAAADIPPPTQANLDLARLALNRVIGEHSEWRELWDETPDLDQALVAVAEVRAALD